MKRALSTPIILFLNTVGGDIHFSWRPGAAENYKSFRICCFILATHTASFLPKFCFTLFSIYREGESLLLRVTRRIQNYMVILLPRNVLVSQTFKVLHQDVAMQYCQLAGCDTLHPICLLGSLHYKVNICNH
jgi:hypothetical protein